MDLEVLPNRVYQNPRDTMTQPHVECVVAESGGLFL